MKLILKNCNVLGKEQLLHSHLRRLEFVNDGTKVTVDERQSLRCFHPGRGVDASVRQGTESGVLVFQDPPTNNSQAGVDPQNDHTFRSFPCIIILLYHKTLRKSNGLWDKFHKIFSFFCSNCHTSYPTRVQSNGTVPTAGSRR